MRISDWSSDVCSSDLIAIGVVNQAELVDADREICPRGVIALAVQQGLMKGLAHAGSVEVPRQLVEVRQVLQMRLVLLAPVDRAQHRSEERRVGKECVRTCRSRWSPYP